MSLLVQNNEEFIKEDMKEFLKKIIEEHLEKSRNIILVPVNKDSYWVYRYLKPTMSEKVQNVRILGYNYPFQLTECEEIPQNTCIILFDLHIVSDDKKLYSYYKYFKRKVNYQDPKIVDVHAYAYGVSTEYLRKLEEGILIRKRDCIYPHFRDSLEWRKYSHIYSHYEATHISIMEMKWIHNDLLPFKENRPVLKCKDEILLSEWEKISKIGFADCIYVQNSSLINLDVTSGVFVFTNTFGNDSTIEFCKNTVGNFFVNCKYKIQNGKIQVVFIPNNIMVKVLYKKDIWNCFEALFRETEYFEKMRQKVQDEKFRRRMMLEEQEDFITIAIIESVICFLSMYYLRILAEQISGKLNRKLMFELDIEALKDNNTEAFVNSIEKIWKTYTTAIEFKNKILYCKEAKEVRLVHISGQEKYSEKFTQEILENYIRLNLIKQESIPLVLIEEQIQNIKSYEKALALISLENDYLISSKICTKENDLFYFKIGEARWEIRNKDNDKAVVYCEIYSEDDIDIFFQADFIYPYTYALSLLRTLLYSDCELDYESEYKSNIRRILAKMEAFWEKEYGGCLIHKDNLYFYEEYLINLENPREQITNKLYLLDSYENKTMKLGKRLIIEEAFKWVEIWL